MPEQEQTRGTQAEGAQVAAKSPSQRRYNLTSNLMTLLVAGVIIAAGFLLPTLLFPYLDLYRDEVIQLVAPPENEISQHVFEEPVTLYPWNLYEEELLAPLSPADRNVLERRGIPDFLIATLRDHGMQPEPDEDGAVPSDEAYRAQILGLFQYLEPRDTAEPGCYVLVDADIDLDGRADIRCATDLEGNLISLLLVSSQWDSVSVEKPIGVAAAPPAEKEQEHEPVEDTEGGEGTGGTGGAEGGEGTGGTEDAGAGAGTADGSGTDGAGADGETRDPGQGDTETGDAAQTGTEGQGTDAVPANGEEAGSSGRDGGASGGALATLATLVARDVQSALDHPPVTEDAHLWSFSYATAREAKVFDQPELFLAFRQLELTYEHRYGYPYTALLPLQPAEAEELPEVEYTALTPVPFATADFLLYIYDLPSGERFILYLDPNTLRCMGFNLLRY
ncbi:MAG: hypothetical protein LBL86_12555 [Coriobacteriales bacterium]|jgi:hypothetical protein|nr:hypothetical protein [Coriobacteriales bacterium]